jgi:hypothetical protein
VDNPRAVDFALRVFRIDEGKSVHVRLTSSKYGGLTTHWKPKRSHYCVGEDCPAALHKLNSFWKGYGAAEVWCRDSKVWLPICLELTEHLELDFRGKWQVGQIWEISRAKMVGYQHQPTRAAFVRQLPSEQTPPAADILPTLLHLYHVPAIKLDVKNPLPAKTMVVASHGEPPVEFDPGLADEADRPKEMAKIAQILADRMSKWKSA